MIEEDRSRNIMVFGLQEDSNEDLAAKASDMLYQLGEKPRIKECSRVGQSTGKGSHRPVKLTMSSSDVVNQVLRKSKELKQLTGFKAVFIAPDRSIEARKIHKTLVGQMKEKNKSEPGLYHFIKNGKVCSEKKERRD